MIVGSPVAGRNRPGLAGVVGYFVNPLPLRRGSTSATRRSRSSSTGSAATVLDGLEHQDFPFAVMVERLAGGRDPGRSPVFQVMFVLQKAQRLDDRGAHLVRPPRRRADGWSWAGSRSSRSRWTTARRPVRPDPAGGRGRRPARRLGSSTTPTCSTPPRSTACSATSGPCSKPSPTTPTGRSATCRSLHRRRARAAARALERDRARRSRRAVRPPAVRGAGRADARRGRRRRPPTGR